MSASSTNATASLFQDGRTHGAWTDEAVDDDVLVQAYELAKWGPTSANGCPLRVIFVRSPAAKEKLEAVLAEANREKTRAAPVTAILCYDLAFHELLPQLSPYRDLRPMFRGNAELTESTAFRNGTLQAAYFMLAARAVGLDCGPMSGFDNALCDEAFLSGTSWRSNFLCNLGHGDKSKLFPRLPRLSFTEVCRMV